MTGLLQTKELQVTNDSDTLNANFQIRCPAHYKVDIPKGTLKPGETRTINIVFHPKQFGRLDGRLCIDVYGEGTDGTPPVHTHSLSVKGTAAAANGGTRGWEQTEKRKKKGLASVNDLSYSVRPHDKRVELM